MEEKKVTKISLSTSFFILAIIIILSLIIGFAYMYIKKNNSEKEVAKLQEESTNYQTKIDELENKIDQIKISNEETTKTNSDIGEYFVLYNGTKIPIKTGKITASYIEKVNELNKEKYNIIYYNYEKGKYVGKSKGILVEGAFDDSALVDNVNKIAMSKKFNATPRTFTKINQLPNEIMDMADYTTVDMHSIDLDGDGKEEKIVCATVNYARGDFGDGEPVAASEIMLLDSNYKEIADLVNLEDGFAEQGQGKHEESKVFLSLDMVDYIDIDNDGIMEIIIDIPKYEGDGLSDLSIIKYNKGNLEGETNIKANVRP